MVRRGIRNKRRGDVERKKGVTQNYVTCAVDKNNEKLFEYYKRQGIIDDGEWEAFVSSLKEDLPAAFRIRGCHREAESLAEFMNNRFLLPLHNSGENIEIPKRLSWYPFAYQTSMSRNAIRSNSLLKSLHNFLVTEAEIGNISRQETVSMIPPLLLDVKSHHKVIDMCAAPGSKTMQILEMMHEQTDFPDGIVVANDANNSRCYLLVHQAMKRMPTSNCVVINQDASMMPTLTLDMDSGEPLLFDRVLCDVICSGDGTFRKNLEMWKSWNPQKGIGLHNLQLKIAQRSVQLLAVNGLMVYSTCSLNPIEDEAVIAAVLRYGAGSIELVDVSHKLPDLKRSPGVNYWKVIDRDMVEYNEIKDVPDNLRRAIIPSMFPPSKEEADKFHLNRCFRVLPHIQNTGGFFVAVLTKTKELSAKYTRTCFRMPPAKRKKTFKEDPFVFVQKDDARWSLLKEHFGIPQSFPYENLFGRTVESEQKRTLYFVNDGVKRFMECNQYRIKIINAGLKMFGRIEHKVDHSCFRLCQDGLKILTPYITKRIFDISVEDMIKILKGNERSENVPRENLACRDVFQDVMSGSVALTATFNGVRQVISTWLGARTIAPYISKEERIHILRMFGSDTSDLEELATSKRQDKANPSRKIVEANKLTSISSDFSKNNGSATIRIIRPSDDLKIVNLSTDIDNDKVVPSNVSDETMPSLDAYCTY